MWWTTQKLCTTRCVKRESVVESGWLGPSLDPLLGGRAEGAGEANIFRGPCNWTLLLLETNSSVLARNGPNGRVSAALSAALFTRFDSADVEVVWMPLECLIILCGAPR